MTTRGAPAGCSAVLGLLLFAAPSLQNARPIERLLDCRTVFPPTVTQDALATRFGPSNVAAGRVYLGEGQYDDGTVLFDGSREDRLEILWKMKRERRQPLWVRVTGTSSHWHTAEGLALGLDLRSIERLNGRPFRLLGFAWDYAGTVVSWSGGRLTPTDLPCEPRIRLSPEQPSPIQEQVIGDRAFSSGHPAMQALNPRVYDLWLSYP